MVTWDGAPLTLWFGIHGLRNSFDIVLSAGSLDDNKKGNMWHLFIWSSCSFGQDFEILAERNKDSYTNFVMDGWHLR